MIVRQRYLSGLIMVSKAMTSRFRYSLKECFMVIRGKHIQHNYSSFHVRVRLDFLQSLGKSNASTLHLGFRNDESDK